MPALFTPTFSKGWSEAYILSADIIGDSHPRKTIVTESNCVEISKQGIWPWLP